MVDIQEAYAFHSQGKFDEAEKLYLEFLEENPKQPDVSNLLGLVYLQTKSLDSALLYFNHAVEGFPCAEYFQNLGLAYFNKKEYKDAMDCFYKAVEFEPKNLELVRNFAQMAKQTGQFEKAVEFYGRCIELDPKDSVGLNNLGLVYEELHDYNSAKTCYQKSLKVVLNYEALHNLGVLYRNERNFDESIKCLKEALKFKPNNENTITSIAMSYLAKKDIVQGYKYFQKNFIWESALKKPEDAKKYWTGEKHPDKTLLVYYSGGYGDFIMSCRYLSALKEYFKNVKVVVPVSMRGLFEKNFSEIEIVQSIDCDYDFIVNIMELPYSLKTDFDSIPFSAGYFKADDEIAARYKKQFFSKQKKKIGLFWQGNDKVLKNRSIKLQELALLFGLNGADFYSFQKEDGEDCEALIDVGSTFKNFSDTAGALMNLDLLITIDSAVAHLAGSLGVKTLLILPYASEWRWFSDEKTTLWYDSVRIFKQKEHFAWTVVVEEVYKKLVGILDT